ncbi:MAG TPA: NTP transferase domain-containing protein [Gemmatimonadales bacterium]|nr:NTP transferase domain-containing protein [Gemmatimonadales bacterium]
MKRVLVVPAAGRGSRLGGEMPKLMVPVNGRPMLDYILDRYRELADVVMLVLHPDSTEMVRKHLKNRRENVELLFQDQPTGMLDAILIPKRRIHEIKPEEIWVTWCDQVAVGEATVQRLAQAMVTSPKPQLAFPTLKMGSPYIHFARDSDGTITSVLQRREGDAMPEMGEGDIGLFALTGKAYLETLSAYAGSATSGGGTGERNFLPFIPWLAGRSLVRTCPATAAIEAVGVNTPEDLAMVGKYLAQA